MSWRKCATYRHWWTWPGGGEEPVWEPKGSEVTLLSPPGDRAGARVLWVCLAMVHWGGGAHQPVSGWRHSESGGRSPAWVLSCVCGWDHNSPCPPSPGLARTLLWPWVLPCCCFKPFEGKECVSCTPLPSQLWQEPPASVKSCQKHRPDEPIDLGNAQRACGPHQELPSAPFVLGPPHRYPITEEEMAQG